MKEFPIYRQTNWGFDQTHLLNEDKITIKTLFLYKKQGTSLQYHHERDEIWIPVNKAKVITGIEENEIELNEYEFIVNPREGIHRLVGIEDASIVTEVSYGNFDEDDVKRIRDYYGRV